MTFFHAFDPDDRLFSHNIFVGKGRIPSASAMRNVQLPGWEGLMSPYQMFTTERPKEETFERIRAREFPDRPTREGAIFLFPRLEDAERANAEWWGNKQVGSRRPSSSPPSWECLMRDTSMRRSITGRLQHVRTGTVC